MNMIFTTVGLDEIATLIAAGEAVQITELAIGTGNWTPDETATALQTELKRLSLTGDKTSNANVHLTAVDSTTDEYTVFEAGVYLSSGTLLAIAGDGEPITGKAARTNGVFAIELTLAQFADADVVIGGTGFMLPQATESVAGILKIKNTHGEETNVAATPKLVRDEVAKRYGPDNAISCKDSELLFTNTFGLTEINLNDLPDGHPGTGWYLVKKDYNYFTIFIHEGLDTYGGSRTKLTNSSAFDTLEVSVTGDILTMQLVTVNLLNSTASFNQIIITEIRKII